jgi:hypothetical protein
VAIASALLINVGTLTPDWVESMKLAAKAARRLGKPWVLDPVGCGATPYRSQVRGTDEDGVESRIGFGLGGGRSVGPAPRPTNRRCKICMGC